jgi:hypothetical protein
LNIEGGERVATKGKGEKKYFADQIPKILTEIK